MVIGSRAAGVEVNLVVIDCTYAVSVSFAIPMMYRRSLSEVESMERSQSVQTVRVESNDALWRS